METAATAQSRGHPAAARRDDYHRRFEGINCSMACGVHARRICRRWQHQRIDAEASLSELA